jgi:ubiquinone biosynthesis protein UbiJ
MSETFTSAASPLLRAAEAALNRLLALDSAVAADLGGLEGRSVALRLKPWPKPIRASVVKGRFRLEDAEAADLSIAATPGALLALAGERGGLSLPAGRIEIAGDADLARRLQKLVAGFSPDLDAPLAAAFGEVAGHQIGKGLRAAFAFGRDTLRTLTRSTADYLREESRDLVAPGEVEAFVEEVDGLRDAVERAEARIQRLARRRAARAGSA